MKRAAVAVVCQLPPELIDEEARVGQDQDTLAACGLDEPGGGDGLAGGCRVPEAVPALGSGIGADHGGGELVGLGVGIGLVDLDGELIVFFVFFVDDLLRGGAVPVAVY